MKEQKIKNRELFSKYRSMYEQCFVPIFVQDYFDTEMLLEGCRQADVQVMEYTLRRADAASVIPALKQRDPGKVVMVGSTIDDEEIVCQMRRKHPQLMTLEELAPYVDGFVSMLPYSDETLEQYKDTHLMIPTAETSGEALRQMKKGASMIKVLGPDFSFSKHLHASPTMNYCPTFLTGGVHVGRMEEAFAAGNTMVAAGFDLILREEQPEELTAQKVAERLRLYIDTAKACREKQFPELKGLENCSDEEFLSVLPNYCSLARE